MASCLRPTPAHLVCDALVALPDGRPLAVPPRLAAKGADHQQQLLARHLAPQEEHQALRGVGWGWGGVDGRWAGRSRSLLLRGLACISSTESAAPGWP